MVGNGKGSLLVQGGPNSGMMIPLAGRPMTLGRRSDNDVVVDESTVSRRHALILETPAGFVLRDLSTRNGTYVNRERVGHEETLLSHGDRIRLAGSDVTFIFQHEGPSTVAMEIESPPTGVVDLRQLEDRGLPAQKPAAQPPPVQTPPKKEGPATQLIGNDPELYRLLQSRKGTVVTRDEIAELVWPELVELGLAEQVINSSIQRLRAQIGDYPEKPTKLITVADAGFLLV